DGQTLNVGRKTRSIPPAIRRALQKRDQGCRFPGCTAQKHVDAHHIQHWADGGETKLDNLVTLCRHHHRAVHEGGFSVRMNPNSQPEFRDAHCKILPDALQTRYRGNVFALINTNRRHGINVTAETCIPNWQGEQMDDDLVVGKLLEMNSKN
ncbi:MAG: HNH endonuclease, partial [Wenzhouxiangella sp.]